MRGKRNPVTTLIIAAEITVSRFARQGPARAEEDDPVQVPKPTPEDRDYFTSLLPPDPRVESSRCSATLPGL
jgi:hypothetical protein